MADSPLAYFADAARRLSLAGGSGGGGGDGWDAASPRAVAGDDAATPPAPRPGVAPDAGTVLDRLLESSW